MRKRKIGEARIDGSEIGFLRFCIFFETVQGTRKIVPVLCIGGVGVQKDLIFVGGALPILRRIFGVGALLCLREDRSADKRTRGNRCNPSLFHEYLRENRRSTIAPIA